MYLAYGRDAQAEEILKDALKKDPQRQEIYLKLLEIHSQHNKPSAFETVASELFAVSHGQGDVWHKAVTLGRQLDPTNPMFQDEARSRSAPPSTAPAGPDRRGGSSAVRDRRQPSGCRDAPAGAARHRGTRDAVVQRRRHLAGSAVGPVAQVGGRHPGGRGERAGAQFEHADRGRCRRREEPAVGRRRPPAPLRPQCLADTLGSAKFRVRDPGGRSVGARRHDRRAAPRFDLDFHLDDADRPAPLEARPREARSEPVLSATASPFAAPATPLDLDKLDLSFDPDRPAFEDPTPSVLDGQWHDAATKLDLAKAYQEMGDHEGAREILQEVLHEGDEQQKSEAQSLLAKLA